MISNLDWRQFLGRFLSRASLTRILVALSYWRSAVLVFIRLVPCIIWIHLLVLHKLLLLRLLHLLIELILLRRIKVGVAICTRLMPLGVINSSSRRRKSLLGAGVELVLLLLVKILLKNELVVHVHLLLLTVVLSILSWSLKITLRWNTWPSKVHLIVHSILIWLLHWLLKSSSHCSLVVMIVHIWHHIRVNGVIGGEVLIRVESC